MARYVGVRQLTSTHTGKVFVSLASKDVRWSVKLKDGLVFRVADREIIRDLGLLRGILNLLNPLNFQLLFHAVLFQLWRFEAMRIEFTKHFKSVCPLLL